MVDRYVLVDFSKATWISDFSEVNLFRLGGDFFDGEQLTARRSEGNSLQKLLRTRLNMHLITYSGTNFLFDIMKKTSLDYGVMRNQEVLNKMVEAVKLLPDKSSSGQKVDDRFVTGQWFASRPDLSATSFLVRGTTDIVDLDGGDKSGSRVFKRSTAIQAAEEPSKTMVLHWSTADMGTWWILLALGGVVLVVCLGFVWNFRNRERVAAAAYPEGEHNLSGAKRKKQRRGERKKGGENSEN